MSTVTIHAPVSVRPRRRRLALGALALVVLLLVAAAAAAGVLIAWDAQYEGRILPGVRVGTTDLSGLDRAAASTVLVAAYPYEAGRLVLRAPDGDLAIPYS